jgi:hypothetical protein
VKAQLALALLAVGPLKGGAAPVPPVRTGTPRAETKDARDPIAFLAREWLSKR